MNLHKELHLLEERDRSKVHRSQYRSLRRCYLVGTFLLICTLAAVLMKDALQSGNNGSDQIKEVDLLPRKTRDYTLEHLLKERLKDYSKDITGHLCLGYGAKCCIEIYYTHDTNIMLSAKAGPKQKQTHLQGTYTHNDKTGSWECTPTEVLFWSVEIIGNETAKWSGDITNNMIASGKMGRSKTEIWFHTQSYVKILDPEYLPSMSKGNEDWVKTWNFEIAREPVKVRIAIDLTMTNNLPLEVRVNPQRIEILEGRNPFTLECSTKLELPPESLLTWKKDGLFLGSFSNGPTNVIHRGLYGNVKWVDQKFILYQGNPAPKDSGVYECCGTSINNQKQCATVNINISSVTDRICTGVKFNPSSPFQINHFQSKPLLRNGTFMTMVWTFNMSDWKISSRYPQCKQHLVNMEQGIEQWFGNSRSKPIRNKRGVVEGILGGIGTVGSLINGMNINSLRSDLETIGYLGKKGVKVQKSLNQLLEKMVVNSVTVLGSSVSHLQDATLALMSSEQETQVARACLEIQVEYSTNLKMMAQALQSGITPLGLLRNLPVIYNFSLDHTELWVNKWLGCKQNVCIGTSLIPTSGQEQVLVPVTSLGVPVSNTQLIHYNLEFTEFAYNGASIEQVDLSSCLHFSSKVVCLPEQDKTIYHSCFHNQSTCHARIETVQNIHDIVTPVGQRKVCIQIMSEKEKVSAFYPSCVYAENLTRGLYCIEGDVNAIRMNMGRFNISSIASSYLRTLPVQYNLSQVDKFPWKMWTEEIVKDKGLLDALTRQLKVAEIVFKHQQGQLDDIEHEWSTMSGSSWWGKFKKSVDVWSKSSAKMAVGNVLSNPIVIIFMFVVVCILYQIFIMCRIKRIYTQVKKEIGKGDKILQEMLKRTQQASSIINTESKKEHADKMLSHGL
ncbi:uncharacterized protein RB166_005735 [Leptodactylus fuscus]|uniref:uncharacterized protein LOC142196900 n=1 Tax=Leptodactylus fuscus TaxID=238119 RepID=UPI003F4EDF73